MQLRKEFSAKIVLAYVLALTLLCALVAPSSYGLGMIPDIFWCKTGMIISAFALVFMIAIIIIGFTAIIVPTLHYICKWFIWAFVFAFFADKTEPHFPPKFTFVKSWEKCGPALGTVLLFGILFGSLMVVCLSFGVAGFIGGLFLAGLLVIFINILNMG